MYVRMYIYVYTQIGYILYDITDHSTQAVVTFCKIPLFLVPVPTISFQPSGSQQRIVGEMQDIICSVTITFEADPDSVELTWTNASSIITPDDRVTVLPTNITRNSFRFTYTTIIQFDYLMEGDEGSYICNFTLDGMTKSRSATLHLRSM